MRLSVILVLSVLLLLVPRASADNCGAVRQRVIIKKEVVAIQAVVVAPIAVYQPLIVQVPVYGAGYVAPYAAPAPAPAVASKPDELTELLKRIDRRLESLEKRGAAPRDPFNPEKEKAPDPVGAPLLVTKCAGCHDVAVADKKGGGFRLSEGGRLLALSDRDARRVLTATYSGRMPKGGKLTDEDVAAIVDFFDAVK